jgi:hypothetical protein
VPNTFVLKREEKGEGVLTADQSTGALNLLHVS